MLTLYITAILLICDVWCKDTYILCVCVFVCEITYENMPSEATKPHTVHE